jgi:hypothetical protein
LRVGAGQVKVTARAISQPNAKINAPSRSSFFRVMTGLLLCND